MGSNIYIQSDFIEPYDKYLHDPMGKIRWKRLSKGGRNRKEIFELMENYIEKYRFAPDQVIPHGTVKELFDKYEEQYVNGIYNTTWDRTGIKSSFSQMVIYTDIMAHRGEGKELMDVEDAIKECPDALASVKLSNEQIFPVSYRNLFIGNEMYQLTYVSLTDWWKSNCGHVQIIYTDRGHVNDEDRLLFTTLEGTRIDSPIFAFDYILIPVATSGCPDGVDRRFYVDFNEAPGIPEEVIVDQYYDNRKGQVVPFTDIISAEKIAELAEKCLKSEKG